MKRDLISGIYADPSSFDGKKVAVGGWARSIRDSKAFGFIDLNDGSCFKGVQIVFEQAKIENYTEVAKSGVGTAFSVMGKVVLTPDAKQPFELNADVAALGAADQQQAEADKLADDGSPACTGNTQIKGEDQ